MNHPVMIRPDWHEFASEVTNSGAHIVNCNCGSTLWTKQELREHWQMGHFDTVKNPIEQDN
ncbi:MAG: hypothetical protein ACXAEN_21890 [Candidatus Thorarchaeota archaeon]|jgi:hypothetical protein